MASVSCTLLQDKHAGMELLDQKAVEEICLQKGCFWREGGKLPPGKTAKCFGWQILMGNVSCDAVAHHWNKAFTGEAYCMARQRLPLEVLEELSDRVAGEALAVAKAAKQAEYRWKGKRTFVIDGTGIRLPDAPEVRAYFGCSGKQKPGCGYPTAHVLLLCGPGGVALEAICSPLRTGDMAKAPQMHRHLQQGDLLMGDRLFGGWGHLHLLQSQKLDGLFPAHHTRKIGWGPRADHGPSRRFVARLGYYDQWVEYRKPRQKPKWMSQKQFDSAPEWIPVREIRRWVWVGGARKLITLVTTLTDAKKYPAKELAKLLGTRWTIELNLRSLKTVMGMERLGCQSIEAVKKELMMYLIVYNLVRLRMLRAAASQGVPLARISFADALDCLRYGSGSAEVKLQVNPLREGRCEPRVVKARPKAFPKMIKPRPQLRRELKARRKAAQFA